MVVFSSKEMTFGDWPEPDAVGVLARINAREVLDDLGYHPELYPPVAGQHAETRLRPGVRYTVTVYRGASGHRIPCKAVFRPHAADKAAWEELQEQAMRRHTLAQINEVLCRPAGEHFEQRHSEAEVLCRLGRRLMEKYSIEPNETTNPELAELVAVEATTMPYEWRGFLRRAKALKR